MKCLYSSILVVATGICFLATATVTSAEEKKSGSNRDRSARQASSNNTDNKKVEKSEKEEAQQEEAKKYPLASRVAPSQKGAPSVVK